MPSTAKSRQASPRAAKRRQVSAKAWYLQQKSWRTKSAPHGPCLLVTRVAQKCPGCPDCPDCTECPGLSCGPSPAFPCALLLVQIEESSAHLAAAGHHPPNFLFAHQASTHTSAVFCILSAHDDCPHQKAKSASAQINPPTRLDSTRLNPALPLTPNMCGSPSPLSRPTT